MVTTATSRLAPRPDTPTRWLAAAARAASNGVRVYQAADSGQWFATSESQPDTCYPVTETSCCCYAAEVVSDPVCAHRAALRARLGLLTMPEVVTVQEVPLTCPDCRGTGYRPQWTGSALSDYIGVRCECSGAVRTMRGNR